MTEKALITSITGQDGSYTSAALSTSLTEFLLARGYEVHGIIRWARTSNRLGTGIRRMAQAMTEHGLPRPRFEEVGSEFRVTLIGPGERFMQEIKTRPVWAEGLNERQVEAVLYVGEHGQISRGKYAALFGVSPRTAARDLNGLINREILALRGAGRGAHYLLRSGSQ